MRGAKINKRGVVLLVLLIYGVITAHGQISKYLKKGSFSTKSPQHTVASFMHYTSADNFEPGTASYVFSDPGLTPQRKIQLTIELRQIIDKKGGLDPADFPKNKNYDQRGKNQCILFNDYPELYLSKINEEWVFGAVESNAIQEIHQNLYPPAVNETKIKAVTYKPKPVITVKEGTQDTIKTYFNLSTPYEAINSYQYYLSDSNYHPEIVVEFLYVNNLTEDQCIEKVIKLEQLFYGRGVVINADKFPRDSNFYDTLLNAHRYIIDNSLPEFYLDKIGDDWKLSETSVNLIDNKHALTYPIGTKRILTLNNFFSQILGRVSHVKFLGIELWQLLFLVLLLLGGTAIYYLFGFLPKLLLRIFINDRGSYPHWVKIINPIVIIMICFTVVVFFPVLLLSKELVSFIRDVLTVIFWFSVMFLLIRIQNLVLYVVQKKVSEEQLLGRRGLFTFMGTIGRILIVIAIGLVILSRLGANITALLTGLSIGGLALALGAQETIKNFFGSIMIFVDRPFIIGDWVVSDGIDGTVEHIGLRSTRIRTFYNSVVTIPNSKIADSSVDNLGLRKMRRYKTIYRVPFETPLSTLQKFINELRETIVMHDDVYQGKYHIHLNEIGKIGYEVLIYIYFTVNDYSLELQRRHEIIEKVIALAEQHNIRFVKSLTD